jgi:Icc-related predicted phosphoesterase
LCDLHFEFGNFVPPVVDADVVVLAGDVHVKNRGLQWIFDQKFEIPVLYVLGNHEFYREKFPGLIDKLKMDAEGTNVPVLENDSVEIGGYRFFGCTLWSDMELLGDQHASLIAAADTMNDYRLIRLEHQPRLWIHGHTHESFDYEIGKTRVVCNPRGYASIEENKGFRPDYTLVV